LVGHRGIVRIGEPVVLIVKNGVEVGYGGQHTVPAKAHAGFRQNDPRRLRQVIPAVGLVAIGMPRIDRKIVGYRVVGADSIGRRQEGLFRPRDRSIERRARVARQPADVRRNRRIDRCRISRVEDVVDILTTGAEVDVQLLVEQRRLVVEVRREGAETVRPGSGTPVAVADHAVVGQGADDAAGAVQGHHVIDR
jgi:hypothetical protein